MGVNLLLFCLQISDFFCFCAVAFVFLHRKGIFIKNNSPISKIARMSSYRGQNVYQHWLLDTVEIDEDLFVCVIDDGEHTRLKTRLKRSNSWLTDNSCQARVIWILSDNIIPSVDLPCFALGWSLCTIDNLESQLSFYCQTCPLFDRYLP